MAQPRETTAGARRDDHTQSYALGQWLSRIFHPIPLNILSFLIVGLAAFPSRAQGLTWAAVCLMAQVLPPSAFFALRRHQGVYTDEDVSVRQQRNELYIFGIVTVVVGTVILFFFGLPQPFVSLLISAALTGVLCALINMWWKISVHGASIGSTAAVALWYSSALGIALWVCAALVGWARVRTRNHTPLQVLAGTMLAATVVFAVFALSGMR